MIAPQRRVDHIVLVVQTPYVASCARLASGQRARLRLLSAAVMGCIVLLGAAAGCDGQRENADAARPLDRALHALQDGDVYARKRAAEDLAKIGPDALPALEQALAHPSVDVRAAATRALAALGPVAIPLLGKAASDDRSVVRDPATAALETFGAQSAPAFADALKSHSHYVRENAATALGGLGKEALPLLQSALDDPDRRVRLCAIESLGRVGPDAIPVLRAIQAGSDPGVQRDVERILDRLQGGGARDAQA
jgi:HEAT repeat protein